MISRKLATAAMGLLTFVGLATAADKYNPTDEAITFISKMKVGKYDWPMWGGTPYRNNTPSGQNIPYEWNLDTGDNVLWASPLGSQTYGNPVVANGKIFIGTNNTHGYLKRYPSKIDLGCLLAFEEKTGKFLWQASSPKLPSGRVHDWPQQGICSTVFCDDKRLWYNTSRGEVTCLDVEGFYDGENNGPYTAEPNMNKDEADIIWSYNMMDTLGISQHNMCSCSLICVGDHCFVITGNGVDEGHINIPAPNAPSFICLNKNTGKLIWSDRSPGTNILHGQWSSPCYFEIDGQAQVVMGGGDGWIYSFDPAGDGKGGAKLLWKFDGNPKESVYLLGGRSTRNHIIGTPVFYDGKVYAGVGEDPEHGEGNGHYYCINPAKRGDVSIELAIGADGKEMPPRRIQSVDPKKDEKAVPNPNSAVVWHYDSIDQNKNGKIEFEEAMHRTIGSAAIKDDLLFISDIAGLVHCIDAKKIESGKPVVYWTHDMFAAAWGSVLIVDGKVYVGDEDGDITIFELSKKKTILAENSMINSIYSTPIVANNTLFISNKSTLFAIKEGAKLKGGVKQGNAQGSVE